MFAVILAKCPRIGDLHIDLMHGSSVQVTPRGLARDSLDSLRLLEITEPRSARWIAERDGVPVTPSHWLTDALSTNRIDAPNLVKLTLKRSRRLLDNDDWASFPRLRIIHLDDLLISGASLGRLISSAASSLAEFSCIDVRVQQSPGSTWPRTVPRIRAVRLFLTELLSPMNFETLLSPFTHSLEELELQLDPSADQASTPKRWPAIPQLSRLVLRGEFLTTLPLMRTSIFTLKHLELVGGSETNTFPTDAATGALHLLSNSLESITLRDYAFSQEEVNVRLSRMGRATSVTLHPGVYGLNQGFETYIPPGARELHFLGHIDTKYFLALLQLLAPDKSKLFLHLVLISIGGDDTAKSWMQQQVLRRLCLTQEIAFQVIMRDRELLM